MVTFTLADLGGGALLEAVVLGWFVGLLMLMGLMGRAAGALTVELDFRTRPDAWALAVPIVGTMVVATVVGYATGATYASRYAAAFVPFALLLAARAVSPRRAGGRGRIGLARRARCHRGRAERHGRSLRCGPIGGGYHG